MTVQDFIVDDSGAAPAQAVLFALNMLVGTESGEPGPKPSTRPGCAGPASPTSGESRWPAVRPRRRAVSTALTVRIATARVR